MVNLFIIFSIDIFLYALSLIKIKIKTQTFNKNTEIILYLILRTSGIHRIIGG